MVRGLNKAFQMPAVIIFRYGKRATLGVIHQREHKKDENKNVLEKVTLIKDISLEKPNRAHIDILAELSLPELVNKYQVRNFDNLLKAWETTLDISELNKRFYKDLVEWFHKACTEVKFPSSKDNPIKSEEHVIRMICRLLFIWFIKEKNLVAEELFDESGMQTLLEKWDKNKGENYYTAILQNLFFATLNTEVDKRAFSKKGQATHRNPNFYRYKDQLKDQDEFLKIIGKTPFINGGLFDCLDSFDAAGKGGYRIDCFTDNDNHRKELSVPNRLFFGEDGLFKLFTRYKFTVEENTPIERDVALDPELLGLTFENLLAEYNPETGETARKQTGSYYTPRQIVDYMADEALTAALAAKVEPYDKDEAWLKDRLRDLLDYGSGGEKDREHLIEEQEIKPLIEAMSRLKVLDPAVGSGAFPMGILNKLVLALEKLDPENKIWKEMQIVHAQQESGKAYQTIDKGETREARLKEINETFEQFSGDFGRKLYLIQNSIFGVDIQTVACQIAKLRVFISLAVEQVGNQKARENYGIRPLPNLETRFVAANSLIGLHQGQLSLARTPKVNEIEQQIKQISDLYFNARTRNKKQEYKQSDTKLRKALADELTANMNLSADEVQQIAGWSPYDQNSSAAWFDPEWMFGVQEGFDIVIANPPYVSAVQAARGSMSEERKIYKKIYDVKGSFDLYVLFLMRGFEALNKKGVLSFIIPNKFKVADYASSFFEFLKKNSQLSIIGVSTFNVFKNTGVYPIILRACKAGDFIYSDLKVENYTDLQRRNYKDNSFTSELKTIRENNIVVSSGLTGFQARKIIPYILNKGKIDNKSTIPFAVSGNIDPYSINTNRVRYMKSTYEKPCIKKCEIIAEQKWAMWLMPKIIIAGMTKRVEAYYSEQPLAIGVGCYAITKFGDYDPWFLLGLLNSRLMTFYLTNMFEDKHLQGGYLAINKSTIEKLPFPPKLKDFKKRAKIISQLAYKLQNKQSDPDADVTPLEAAIDQIIYKLYDLTPDEITLIQTTTPNKEGQKNEHSND